MLEAALVAWLVALIGDRTFAGGVRVVFGTSAQRALAEAMNLAIMAMMQDLPSQSSAALGAALRERFGEGPGVILDGRTRVRSGLIEAIRRQIGPLAEEITPTGTSFFEEIGIDPAWVCDELAGVVIRSIEQVGAKKSALTPLAAQLNADAILDKVDEVLSRLEQPGQRPGATHGTIGDEPDVPAEAVGSLVRALLEVPTIKDDSSRQEIIGGLPEPIPNVIPRAARPNVQVLAMVRTCLNYPGGLRALVDDIRLLEGDSLAMRRLDTAILGIFGTGDQPGPGTPNGQAAHG
jgi:hypothetical protein